MCLFILLRNRGQTQKQSDAASGGRWPFWPLRLLVEGVAAGKHMPAATEQREEKGTFTYDVRTEGIGPKANTLRE